MRRVRISVAIEPERIDDVRESLLVEILVRTRDLQLRTDLAGVQLHAGVAHESDRCLTSHHGQHVAPLAKGLRDIGGARDEAWQPRFRIGGKESPSRLRHPDLLPSSESKPAHASEELHMDPIERLRSECLERRIERPDASRPVGTGPESQSTIQSVLFTRTDRRMGACQPQPHRREDTCRRSGVEVHHLQHAMQSQVTKWTEEQEQSGAIGLETPPTRRTARVRGRLRHGLGGMRPVRGECPVLPPSLEGSWDPAREIELVGQRRVARHQGPEDPQRIGGTDRRIREFGLTGADRARQRRPQESKPGRGGCIHRRTVPKIPRREFLDQGRDVKPIETRADRVGILRESLAYHVAIDLQLELADRELNERGHTSGQLDRIPPVRNGS